MKTRPGVRWRLPMAMAALVVLAPAACSSGSSGTGPGPASAVDMAAELTKPAELTFWTWVPDIQSEVDLFTKEYPNIKVNVVNVGQPPDYNTKLRTALKAGSGAPDVVQLELHELPSFVLTNDVLDLSPYGAGSLKNVFLPWVWNQVTQGAVVHAIPQDTGPMGMLYRQDIFDEHGIAVPKTWDEFAAAAKKLHDADPNIYLTNLAPNNGTQFNGLLWQAGNRPFRSSGQNSLAVNIDDGAARKVASYWTPLIQQGLVSTDPDFTDQWFRGFAGDKYATWLTAAWGPVFLQNNAKGTEGKWRAAPLPQWKAGENISGNWGGSSNAVIRGSKYPAAAAALAQFINSDPESTKLFASKQFLFPATTALLSDQSFRDTPLPFYGGQKVNQVFADISSGVRTDYTWSPFQGYVFSVYTETAGKAMTDRQDIAAALAQWQSNVVDYARKQGFTVTEGG